MISLRKRASGAKQPSITIPLPRINSVVIVTLLLVIGLLSGTSGYFIGTTTYECDDSAETDVNESVDNSQYYYDQLKNYWIYLFPFGDSDTVTVEGGISGNDIIMNIKHTARNENMKDTFRFIMQSNGIIKDVQVIG